MMEVDSKEMTDPLLASHETPHGQDHSNGTDTQQQMTVGGTLLLGNDGEDISVHGQGLKKPIQDAITRPTTSPGEDVENPTSSFNDKEENDHLGTLEVRAWKESLIWSEVLYKKQNKRERLNYIKLSFSFIAVVLQILATKIIDGKVTLFTFVFDAPVWLSRNTTSLLAGACLLVVKYTTDSLNEESFEGDRTDSAIIANRLQSEVYKSLAGVSPYKSRDKHSVKCFIQRRDNILKKVDGFSQRLGLHPIAVLSEHEAKQFANLIDNDDDEIIPETMPKLSGMTSKEMTLTFTDRRDLYMKARVDHVLLQNIEGGKNLERKTKGWRHFEQFLVLFSALFGVFFNNSKSTADIAVWAIVFTTAAAAVSSFIKSSRYEENSALFFEHAIELSELKKKWRNNDFKSQDDATEWDKFVCDVEENHLEMIAEWKTAVLSSVKKEIEKIEEEQTNNAGEENNISAREV